jgi:hypothetical protein
MVIGGGANATAAKYDIARRKAAFKGRELNILKVQV